MSNIPDDIKERAERIYAEDLFDGTENYIAYAMMLERNRCLEIVKDKCEGDLDYAAYLISKAHKTTE